MKAKYEVNLRVTIIHDIDTIANLKGSNEFATDLAQMICDEATNCGAVACYEIIDSKIYASVKNNNDAEKINFSYDDFMKKYL